MLYWRRDGIRSGEIDGKDAGLIHCCDIALRGKDGLTR
jgi:hypothetical protein